MEESQSFPQQLEERLDARRDALDSVELPRLKETFKIFQAAFVGMIAVLLKKGVLHEDPYQYDLKISDVTVPSESPFAESEKADQVSVRVSQYQAYLDFLINYYQFSCEFLTMGRVKRILALVKYYNFQQFTETSTLLNTRALAEIAATVKKGTDPLSASLVADSSGQLEKTSREILARLKDLTEYHRERYKLDMRQLVLPLLPIDADMAIGRKEEAVRLVKRKFSELSPDQSFYPELLDELLLEDFSSDGPAMREEVLRRFAPAEKKKADEAQTKSFKAVLVDGLKALSSASFPLEDALAKLDEDSLLLASLEQGFGAKLKRMLRRIFAPENKDLVYTIMFQDPVTGSRTAEDLDYRAFAEDAGKKAKFLASLAQRGGASAKRVEGMTDEQCYKLLQRNIEEIQRILRVLAALEEYFKSEVPVDVRARVRAVRSEITTIKGAVIKANQKKHEYVAQTEEREQMRRLGIKDPDA
jgi:hypothetical protein